MASKSSHTVAERHLRGGMRRPNQKQKRPAMTMSDWRRACCHTAPSSATEVAMDAE